MWDAITTDDFDEWFAALDDDSKEEIDAAVTVLRTFGPRLGRPHVDTLNGAKFANMKELRVRTRDAAIRIAFAFDPAQRAILLTGGNKAGVNEKRFYRQLIERADLLLASHVTAVEKLKAQARPKPGKSKGKR